MITAERSTACSTGFAFVYNWLRAVTIMEYKVYDKDHKRTEKLREISKFILDMIRK